MSNVPPTQTQEISLPAADPEASVADSIPSETSTSVYNVGVSPYAGEEDAEVVEEFEPRGTVAVYDPSTKDAIEGEIVSEDEPTRETSWFDQKNIWSVGHAAVDSSISVSDFLDGLLKSRGVVWGAGTFTKGDRAPRRTPEVVPVKADAESVAPTIEEEVTPERFDAAANVLTAALDGVKNGLAPSVASIDQLQAALRDVTDQNAEGARMVRDIERIREAALELERQGAQQGRKPHFMDMLVRYDRLYHKALRNNNQVRAEAILRRKELSWMLTNRGDIDVLSLFRATR